VAGAFGAQWRGPYRVTHPLDWLRYETDTYCYARSIPLRDADDALRFNKCELTTDDGGKVLYHHAFATGLALDDHHVVAVIAATGKSRTRTP